MWGLAPYPYRLADVDDLLTNTGGALLGWFIGRAAIRFLPDPTPVKRSDVDPPGPTRQTVGFFLDIYTYLLIDVVVIITLGLLGLICWISPAGRWCPPPCPGDLRPHPRPTRSRRTRHRRSPPRGRSRHQHVDTATLTALVVRWLIVWLPAVVGVWWLVLCLFIDGVTPGVRPTIDHSPCGWHERDVSPESLHGVNRSETREPTP